LLLLLAALHSTVQVVQQAVAAVRQDSDVVELTGAVVELVVAGKVAGMVEEVEIVAAAGIVAVGIAAAAETVAGTVKRTVAEERAVAEMTVAVS
jgi:hypothetical protein